MDDTLCQCPGYLLRCLYVCSELALGGLRVRDLGLRLCGGLGRRARAGGGWAVLGTGIQYVHGVSNCVMKCRLS